MKGLAVGSVDSSGDRAAARRRLRHGRQSAVGGRGSESGGGEGGSGVGGGSKRAKAARDALVLVSLRAEIEVRSHDPKNCVSVLGCMHLLSDTSTSLCVRTAESQG